MNTKHISLAFAATAALLAGCAKSPIETQSGTNGLTDLELTYVGSTEVKSVIDGTTFPTEEEIGLFLFADEQATKAYGTGYENIRYAYNSDKEKWTASPSIKVGSETGYLYGYYPYNSAFTNVKEIPVASSLNGDDVMYAAKQAVTDATASQTTITMNHALARVSLTVINNGYSGDGELTAISFSEAEISQTGTLNSLDGTITAKKSNVTLEIPEDCSSITEEGTTYECLLVPSKAADGKQSMTLTLTIDGVDNEAELSEDNGVIIAKGSQSNIIIEVSDSGITVRTVSVEDQNVVEVAGHKVKVELSEDEDDIDDDVLTKLKINENTVKILAYSLSGEHLKCTLTTTGTAEVTRYIDKVYDSFTFTISKIDSDVTATIGYEERLDVTVTSNNSNWGTATIFGECYKDETITFMAIANYGFEFVEWQDADGNKLDWENPQDTTLTSNLTVEAVFKIAGALPGKFTVDPGPDGTFGTDDDKKVYFSQGNLQAKYSEANKKHTWSFAAHQYDVIGGNPGNTTIQWNNYDLPPFINNDNAVVDLFCWSSYAETITFGICYGSGPYYSGNFLEWGTTIGDKKTWRTLSHDEWSNLFHLHPYSCGVKVMGIDNCCVLYPDGYNQAKMVNSGDKGTYNTEDAYNAATEEGIVFLPPTGYRQTNYYSSVGYRIEVSELYKGYYWSSTLWQETTYPYYCYIMSDNYITSNHWDRNIGMAVRLVTDYHEL